MVAYLARRRTPDVHIFTRSKLPWVRLHGGATAFETAYKIDDVWPAASKERLRRNADSRSWLHFEL